MDFVPAAAFWYPDEAMIARSLLQSADVTCYLENEYVLSWVWPWNCALGGLRLMVPGSQLADAQRCLGAPLFADQLRPRIGVFGRVLLTLAIISTPAVSSLHLLYVHY
jgi:hypothetical protein